MPQSDLFGASKIDLVPPVIYTTDCSKVVALVLFVLCVAEWLFPFFCFFFFFFFFFSLMWNFDYFDWAGGDDAFLAVDLKCVWFVIFCLVFFFFGVVGRLSSVSLALPGQRLYYFCVSRFILQHALKFHWLHQAVFWPKLYICFVFVVFYRNSAISFITKTCIYNFDPFKPHFYIV